MKISTLLKGFTASALSLVMFTGAARAQAFTEDFNDITTLAGNGWSMQNNSTPVGSIANWFQGSSISAGGPFDAYNGAANAYIAANYNFVAGANTISGWLITPNRTIKNGDVLTFYTRKASPDSYADRLQVRMSTNGASTNVGTSSTSLGDFTTLLMEINPTQVLGVYPTTWTQYTITVSGLPAPTSGRFAFRYFVTNGGPSGANSDYIGIDNVVYTPYVCPSLTLSPSSLSNGTAGVAYSQSFSQTGALGSPSYAVTAGALPTGMSLSLSGVLSGTPTATGTFNFTVTVADASGCTGTQAYSITVGCPVIGITPTSLPSGTAGAAYSQSLSQSGGVGTITYSVTSGTEPSGTTLSSTGTLSGTPTATGTYTFTVTATDQNGCTGSQAYTVVINCPSNVATLASFTPVCSNNGAVTLTGGSPAGGAYSGTGVSGGLFDPSVGTQTITYTYTDVYSCVHTSSQTFTVNTAPAVSLAPFTPVCDNSGAVALIGESPAGGTYSGTNVSGGMFDPSMGTQTITYIYSDGTCSDTASQVLTVNAAPIVSLAAFTAMPCENDPAFALSGGSPAGGTYSGTNVSGGMFDPIAAGTYTITYTYSDGTCSASDSQAITVDLCTGIHESTAAGVLECFPNPGSDLFTVRFNQQNGNGKLVVRILDMQGKVIMLDEQADFSGSFEKVFDLGNVASGVYMLEVRGERTSMHQKLIVQ